MNWTDDELGRILKNLKELRPRKLKKGDSHWYRKVEWNYYTLKDLKRLKIYLLKKVQEIDKIMNEYKKIKKEV